MNINKIYARNFLSWKSGTPLVLFIFRLSSKMLALSRTLLQRAFSNRKRFCSASHHKRLEKEERRQSLLAEWYRSPVPDRPLFPIKWSDKQTLCDPTQNEELGFMSIVETRKLVAEKEFRPDEIARAHQIRIQEQWVDKNVFLDIHRWLTSFLF